MATIVTRETTQTDGTSPKGSPLTNAEVDTNFINLNDNKVEVSGAIVFAAKAGEALTKGEAVYVSGVSGNEPVVSKADADAAGKMPAFGLAETDASLNAAVNVVVVGTLYDIDTSGFATGDTVFVSTTAGALTNTKPAGESALIQNVGKVIRSHATAGSIKVAGAGRANDTPNLNDGNVFIGNASNQAVARALTGDDISGGTITSFASTGIDDNASQTSMVLSNGSMRILSDDFANHIASISGYDDTNTTQLGKLQFGAATGQNSGIYSTTAFSISNAPGDASYTFTVDTANNEVEINGDLGIGGIANPQAPLHVYKSEASVGETDPIARFERFTTGDNQYLDITVDNDNNLIGFQSTGTSDGGFTFGGAATERMRLTSAGLLGILTNNPARELDIKLAQSTITTLGQKGGINLYSPSNTVGNGGEITWSSAINGEVWAAISGHIISNGSGTAGGELVFATTTNAALPTERMRLDAAGNLGIGTSDPNYDLEISSAANELRLTNTGTNSTYAMLNTANNDASMKVVRQGTNVSSVEVKAFGNASSITMSNFAGIETRFDSLSGGDFTISLDDGVTDKEFMYFDYSTQNIGIGTASPAELLHVNEASTSAARMRLSNTDGYIEFGTNNQVSNIDSQTHTFRNEAGTTEYMRIDTSGRVGIGTAPNTALHVSSAVTTKSVVETTGTSSDALIEFTRGQGSGNSWSIGLDQSASSALSFAYLANGSPSLTTHSKMVIDSSGNVGIGTASPTATLDVAGQIISSDSFKLTANVSTPAGNAMFRPASNTLAFATNSTERMRIDSSGNVGIGTNTINRKLEIAGNNNGGAKANYLRITDTDTSATLNNQNGGIEFYTSDTGNEAVTASIEAIYAGSGAGTSLTFSTAPSGVTGASERLRIDNNGNVGIGTNSIDSGVKIHVEESSASLTAATTSSVALFERAGNAGISIGTANTGEATIFFQDTDNATIGRVQYDHADDSLGFWANSNERMRINSSGNVQISANAGNFTDALLTTRRSGNAIDWGHSNTAGYGSTLGSSSGSGAPFIGFSCGAGTTSNTFKTTGIAGSLIQTDNAGSLLFSRVTTANADNQSSTESMRITSSGNLLFTTTNTPNTIRTSSTAGDTGIALEAASPYFVVSRDSTGANIYTNKPNQSTATATDHIQFRQAGTLVGEIAYDGTDIIIDQSSDARLKENIQDSDSGLEIINTAQVRYFDWLNGTRQSKRFGFVAQELHKVFPDAVRVGGEDPVSDPWSISEAKLIPVLTKAMQELSAQVNELKAEVAALKGA